MHNAILKLHLNSPSKYNHLMKVHVTLLLKLFLPSSLNFSFHIVSPDFLAMTVHVFISLFEKVESGDGVVCN